MSSSSRRVPPPPPPRSNFNCQDDLILAQRLRIAELEAALLATTQERDGLLLHMPDISVPPETKDAFGREEKQYKPTTGEVADFVSTALYVVKPVTCGHVHVCNKYCTSSCLDATSDSTCLTCLNRGWS